MTRQKTLPFAPPYPAFLRLKTTRAKSATSRRAVLARAQMIVNVLSERYVIGDWHKRFDKKRAARFLEAVRRFDFKNTGSKEFRYIGNWIADHGQSLDWLYLGDTSGLICGAAAINLAYPTWYADMTEGRKALHSLMERASVKVATH